MRTGYIIVIVGVLCFLVIIAGLDSVLLVSYFGHLGGGVSLLHRNKNTHTHSQTHFCILHTCQSDETTTHADLLLSFHFCKRCPFFKNRTCFFSSVTEFSSTDRSSTLQTSFSESSANLSEYLPDILYNTHSVGAADAVWCWSEGN